MDKAALLTAPTAQPLVSIRRRSDWLSLLSPTTTAITFWCHRAVGWLLVFFVLRAFHASSIAASSILWTTGIAATRSYRASCTLSRLLGRGTHIAWESNSIRRVRKKLVFEFMVLVLGPAGNGLLVVVFWPGWWFLALVAGATWWISG